MFRSILVPLDGSAFGEHALPWAATIAQRAGARLRFIYVHALGSEAVLESSPFYDEELRFKVRTKQRAYLEDTARLLRPRVDSIDVEVAEGDVAETIREHAVQNKMDLVVMATHARGAIGRFFLGSVADRLVRTLPMPVLLVRPNDERVDVMSEAAIRHLLVPLDGSPFAEQILEPAVEMARIMGADMTLLRVVLPLPAASVPLSITPEPMFESMMQRLDVAQQSVLKQAREYLDKVAARLRPTIKSVNVSVVEQNPADEILRTAAPPNFDLLALATHGRGGIARLVLGSIADKLIRGAQVPVLTLRPQEST